MSSIDKYVEEVKKKTEGYTEDELVRYIYMDLGKRLSFNLKFAFGNSKTKREIYLDSGRKVAIEEGLDTDIIICRNSSYLLEEILKRFGVNIVTYRNPDDHRKCAHVYNLIRPADGRPIYKIDLQMDLENIQSHMRTKEFGTAYLEETPDVISRDELERIDKKIGYIQKDYYYADEYIDLLRLDSDYIEDLGEKLKFILENIDIYHNKEMKYAERKWHHETMLYELFTPSELKRIRQIDCYTDDEEGRHYQHCIVAEIPKNRTDVYLFSVEDNHYYQVSIEELAQMVDEGLVILETINALKQYMKHHNEAPDGR